MVRKIIITTAAILVFVSVNIVAIYFYCRHITGFEKVYVASHQIFQRTFLSEDDIEEIEIPKGYILEGVYTNKEDIIGKYVKLSYSIPKGSMFYKGALETGQKDELYTLLMKDQVSYDLYTTDVKVNSGTLSKNMFVDLYLTISNNGKPVSDLLLKNARIIGLYDNNEQQILDYDQNSKVYIISVAIEKKDVAYLNKASVLGDIRVLVSSDTYSINKRSSLNEQSVIFEYLE